MDKETKRNSYSVAILICLLLIFSSNPVAYFTKDENINYYSNLILRVIFTVVGLIYIKKNNLLMPKVKMVNVKHLLFIPFLLLAFSNIFVGLYNHLIVEEISTISIIKLILVSVFTAVNEEIVFRGALEGELLKHNNKLKSIIYASLIFGGVHLLNISSFASIPSVLLQVGYSMYLGMILGLFYAYSDNIILPVAMHMSFNVINNDIASNIYNLDYNASYFIINIGLGAIIALYYLLVLALFRKWEERKNASGNMDI